MKPPELKVLFNSYPVAFDCPGGGEVQLMECKAALERRGIIVLLYNQWEPQFNEVDVVHHFSVQGGATVFLHHAKRHGKPTCLSPILWLGENKYDYNLIETGNALKTCDIALPNSEIEGKKLAEWYQLPKEKFIPIVNGVDSIFFEPADPEIFRNYFNVQEPFLLSVGNIEPRKNQLSLIKASKDLGIKILMVGQIRDQAYWESCQAHLHKDIEHIGAVEFGSELHRSAYAGCQAFVLPSLLETPGLAALEAAAIGKPICITAEGCTREYFKDFALYVNSESIQSIRTGLIELDKYSESSERAAFVKGSYTWDKAAEQLEFAYKRLISC